MRPLNILLAALLATLLLSTPAQSADGVVEINQACALIGCYSGDAPGFPVFIKEPGSYKLTGSLGLTETPGTTGIQIAAPFVTLDLNGFEIVGPIVCTGSGPTLNCGAVTDGAAVLVQANARSSVVRNGTVRNMGSDGVRGQSDGLTIENIRAINNARDGVWAESNTLVYNSIATENGEDGFDVEFGSVLRGNTAVGNGDDGIEVDGIGSVVDNSTANNNGNRGFHLAHSNKFGRNNSRENVNPNSCGGGICSEVRRYYLTPLFDYDGNETIPACITGFHFASMWELLDTSSLVYDTSLGHTAPDSGTGPPRSIGWVRTGFSAVSYEDAGNSNCDAWTSDSGALYGTISWLTTATNQLAQEHLLPWGLGVETCDDTRPVWCIED